MMLIHEGMNDMSDNVVTINIKKNGDIQINICQSKNNENENKKESEKPITEIIGDNQEFDWINPVIQKTYPKVNRSE